MCWLADNYFVYCEHHTRTVEIPCARALNPADGHSTTGCWESNCTNHLRHVDFCRVCKTIGKATEADRIDRKNPFGVWGSAEDNPNDLLKNVTIRPVEERGGGKDAGIWLKSFGRRSPAASAASSGATSASASRRGSEDVTGMGGSQYSTSARPRRARQSNLDPVEERDSVEEREQEQPQSISPVRTTFNAVTYAAAQRASRLSDVGLSPTRQYSTVHSPISHFRLRPASIHAGPSEVEQSRTELRQRKVQEKKHKHESFARREKEDEREQARPKVEQDLMAKMQPDRGGNEERALNQPDWLHWALTKGSIEKDARKDSGISLEFDAPY